MLDLQGKQVELVLLLLRVLPQSTEVSEHELVEVGKVNFELGQLKRIQVLKRTLDVDIIASYHACGR